MAEYKHTYRREDYPEMGLDYFETRWLILKCAGCDEISVINVFSNVENEIEIRDDRNTRVYPIRMDSLLPETRFNNLPEKIGRIYSETRIAYYSKQFLLCAAGIRAVIEAICIDQQVERGKTSRMTASGKPVVSKSLEGRINGLAEKGILLERHARALHQHRFLGNTAIHEMNTPTQEVLSEAIEIIHHTLENLYELAERESRIVKMRKITAP